MLQQSSREQMTREQRLAIINAAGEASGKGDYEELERLSKLLPMAPYLAKAVKEIHGKEHLLNLGYDLSEAETEYGADWLDR
jgi:hypothetical protein